MIRRRHQETFLFVLILTIRAACVPSTSLYEIQAYKFSDAFDPPPPPPSLKAAAMMELPQSSEQDTEPEASLDLLEAKETKMKAPIEETRRKTTNAQTPLKVPRQSSAAGAASTVTAEPTRNEDAALHFKGLNKGGDAAEPERAVVWGHKPSPQHYGPIEDEFLPLVGGTINLEHLEPTAVRATKVSPEYPDAGMVADISESSGWNSGTTNATSTRVPASFLDYYYKPYYTTTSNLDPASTTQYEEEGYYYKPFLTPTISSSNASQNELNLSTAPTTIAVTTTTVTSKPTLLQKILDGEFNFFNDPVANWITFFTVVGVFFQFFATPFGQVTTGRRRRRKKRVERKEISSRICLAGTRG